jgi:two-component system sensor histidine kinase PhoQ
VNRQAEVRQVESRDQQGEKARRARPFSLRIRLIVLATVILMVALAAVGMALSAAHQRASVNALRERMESYVYLVLAASEVTPDGALVVDEDLGDPRLTQPGSGIYARVHYGREYWDTPSSLGVGLPELPELEAGETTFMEPTSTLDFFTFRYGIAWQLPDESVVPMTVSILVDAAALEEQVEAFQHGLVRWLATAGIILVLAQSVMIALAFRPLQRVADDVAGIESGRTARLEGGYPRELEPLARNVNRLLDTEKANQERYRNALDSLAHSLKTPLAVIRAGVNLDSEEARNAIDKAAEDMDHLISTRLQRAAASTRRTLGEPVAMAPQVERVLTSLKKVYSRKMIKADVSMEPELMFYGEKRDLLEIMGNLLDNAFKYGASAVRVSAATLGADRTRPGLWLKVEDDGPGIDPDRWALLLQRGVRGDERVEGHGLGLAIVLELVSAYGGDISIAKSELGGASVRVEVAPS